MTIKYKRHSPFKIKKLYGDDFRLERIVGIMRYEVEMDKKNNIDYLGVGELFNLLDKEIHFLFEENYNQESKDEYEMIIRDMEDYNLIQRKPIKERGLKRDAEANFEPKYKRYSDVIYRVPHQRFSPGRI